MAKDEDPNFSDILDMQSSEIERPKPAPAGTYSCVVSGLPEHGLSAKKKTPFVMFLLKPTSARDDVDADELEEALTSADGSTKKLGDLTFRATYYTTPDAMWRLKEFLDDCGIPDDGTIRQRIDQAPNKEVLATIRHEASSDGKAMFAQLAGTAAV